MEHLTIRPAGMSDVSALASLMEQLGYPIGALEMEARLTGILPHSDYQTLVADINRHIVAMIGVHLGSYYEKNGVYGQIVALVVEAARQRLLREGLASDAEVRTARAEHLDLLNAQAAACLAQTVFIHLPADALQQTLAEMVRAVRHGGRVLSVDQDGDTWVIDHPDRELTQRIVRFNSDQRYADGWIGRQLRRLFLEAGLVHVEVHCWIHSDTDASSYLFGMAERLALTASEAGLIGKEEAIRWIHDLRGLAAQGNFFSSMNYYACVGVRA